jgi:glycosyltransferase involved in cell wall biosynthesis
MSRARITHLSLGLHMGGMEKLLVEFARHADRKAFDLRFVSLTTAGAAAQEIEQLGWPVVALDQPPGLRPGLAFLLAGVLREGGAQIVHTHNTKALLYGAPAARLARASGVIHTRHGQRHGATRRQTVLFNLMARYADRVVSVSNDSSRLAARQGLGAAGSMRSRLITIHNGIDLSRFNFTGPRTAGPAIVVGRLSPEKDLSTLLRAVKIVVSHEPSFRLHLAGCGPCLSDLQRLCQELGLRDRVMFQGQVQDIAAALSGASLFVLPSLTEGISLALLEAMACGLPAVATRVGGNPEVILDGQTGLLVPPQSVEDLATAMLKIYRDPALAIQLGTAGRRRVEAEFDARGMVARYESLYLATLQAKRRRLMAAA